MKQAGREGEKASSGDRTKSMMCPDGMTADDMTDSCSAPSPSMAVLFLLCACQMHANVRRGADGVWRCEVPECGWSRPQGSCNTARRHVLAAHPGLKPHTLTRKERGNKVLTAAEAKAERQVREREASRRYRERERRRRAKKGAVSLPGEHPGSWWC